MQLSTIRYRVERYISTVTDSWKVESEDALLRHELLLTQVTEQQVSLKMHFQSVCVRHLYKVRSMRPELCTRMLDVTYRVFV